MSSQKILEDGKLAYKEGRYLDCTNILEGKANDSALEKELRVPLYIEYGRALQKLARYEESEQFLCKALELLDSKDDSISQQHCDALLELGMLCYEQELLSEAEDHLYDALEIAEALYQAPHSEIAKVKQGLAEVFWKRGAYTEALSFAEDAIEMQKQTIGELHEEYAESLETRALALLHMGKLDEAEACFRESFEIRKKILPPDHAFLATSYSNIAHCLGRQGRDEGVEEMIQRAIEICTKSYGEYSPRTAVVVNNLGGYHLDHGNLNEAAKYFERALELKEKVLGKDSQSLLRSLNNLAVVYGSLNRKADAQEMSRRASELMKSKIASSDQKDIDTMILLADRLSVSKQHAEADAVLSQALESATKEYGPESLKVAQVLHHVASKAQNAGDSDKAFDCNRRLLKIQKKQLGKKHPKVAETLRAISLSLMMQGLGDVAEILNQQAQAIERSRGLEDPQIAAMRKVLNRERAVKGSKDPTVIQNLRTLSEMYRMRGQSEKADECYEEYIKLREEEAGPDNLEFARELVVKAMSMNPLPFPITESNNEAPAFDQFDESTQKSIEMLKKALGIQQRQFTKSEAPQKEISELSSTMQTLASAYISMKLYDDAEKLARKSIELLEQVRGENHWSLAASLNLLRVALKQKGLDEESKKVEERQNSIPPATPEEQNEHFQQITERMFGSMGRMLEGLTRLSEGVGADEGLEPLPGFADMSALQSLEGLDLGGTGELDAAILEMIGSGGTGAFAGLGVLNDLSALSVANSQGLTDASSMTEEELFVAISNMSGLGHLVSGLSAANDTTDDDDRPMTLAESILKKIAEVQASEQAGEETGAENSTQNGETKEEN